MDKNAIKKFAIWARTELISRVAQKALKYGIEEGKDIDKSMTSFHDYVFSNTEISQRNKLISKIEEQGYQNVIEEIAYTWFNRFCAIRFMEVNGYLPSHVRVFSDDDNNFDPQIIHEAINLDFVNVEKVYELREANKNEELYRYLLISQCNELSKILPGMFQKISDYTELLLPDYLLRDESVLKAMVEQIPQDDWTEQVQILGWMYQYYNTEPKDKVFADLKKNIKISKENIPAATQLFTPDWIVRYMVENSLGRLWAEGHGKPANAEWKYYLEEAEQEDDVKAELEKIRAEYKNLKPEDIRCIDPCSGSGHILCYMFDVLVQIYEDFGYSARESAELIIKNNLYGLDIDDRAAQLAYFAVMMKARQYDRRFFAGDEAKAQPHVYGIKESNGLDMNAVDQLIDGDAKAKVAIESLISQMKDAKTYGSLISVAPVDFELLYKKLEENGFSLFDMSEIEEFVKVAELLSMKYDICCTNPPYMGGSGMNNQLSDFVKKNYPDTKSDLSTCFMEKCSKITMRNGFYGMINIPVWMFLSSYEKLRENIMLNNTYSTMLHFGRGIFGSDFGTVGFVFYNSRIKNYIGSYRRLFEKQGAVDSVEQKEKWFVEGLGKHIAKQENFSKIPGSPVAYWVSLNYINAISNEQLEKNVSLVEGVHSRNNDEFLRLWYEIAANRASLHSFDTHKKWFPYSKGGNFRLWYGNNDYVINWENDGYAVKSFPKSSIGKTSHYFEEGITFTIVTSARNSFRYAPKGFIYDVSGPTIYTNIKDMYYILGLLNTKFIYLTLRIFNPTISIQIGDVKKLPFINSEQYKNNVDKLVIGNISISKKDWDSFETSWDFEKHPFINGEENISKSFDKWSSECDDRFNTLKSNEEELNRIFIDIYGLKEELTPEVEDKDVTVRKSELTRDIKSFISYAVGCLFGRYSLDVSGLAYAGGEWDSSKYKSIIPDSDNIIPICDDEYFEDDLTGLFIDFVKVVYGEDTLEENLKFIADALCGKGTPREIIRKYFLNDFYADHCKTYQKRPIYWLFDSGKKNGFKCLIYMHRYQKDTIAKIRTDYVHEQQARYRTEIESLETRMDSVSASESVKLKKKLQAMKDQAEEILAFEEKVHHLADQMIEIDLDDGVKNNYEIFKDVLAKIK